VAAKKLHYRFPTAATRKHSHESARTEEHTWCGTDIQLRRACVQMSEITEILESVGHGHPKAAHALLTLVYDELRRVASQRMSRESPGHTLQPTALVHEAWLRLAGGKAAPEFENRAHFFGAAAEAMRRILVESARRKKRLKHGGNLERMDIDDVDLAAPLPNDELLAMDEALDALAAVDGRAAEMVKLCFFAGLTQEEAGRELGVSLATAERIWSFARAWLFREMQKQRDIIPKSGETS
jgi:RNA polymerase sigma factor (TIGR02999 family)